MKQVACLVALALLCSVCIDAQKLSTTITVPVTAPWNTLLRDFSVQPPIGTYPNNPDPQPSQVHLSIAGPDAITVMWSTGQYKTGKGSLTPKDPTTSKSIVMYGTSNTSLTQMATGTAEVYNQIYNGTAGTAAGVNGTTLNYTSPILHNAVLSNLTPNTKYYYKVGDGQNFSSIFSFNSLSDAGPTFPQRIITLADWGISANASSTLDHALISASNTSSSPVVFYIADYCYADTWYANGTGTGMGATPAIGFEGYNSGTYQPVWDEWQNFIQPLVSQVPMVGTTGNHEIEQQNDANQSTFVSVQARWKMPSAASGSPSYFFHSSQVGPVHGIFLSPYVDYTPGSAQYQWLAYDLMTINRTLTPFVTVSIHNPWFTTDPSYKEFEQMRASLEPLTYKYGVDIFFYGHVHAYERTAPMYDFMVDPCGAVHITIGDAGNSEGLSFLFNKSQSNSPAQYEDLNGGCPNVTSTSQRLSYITPINAAVNDPWAYYKHVLTFQADGNSTGIPGTNPIGYCYKEQPVWSAYREPSFGHGTLDVVNSTHALWGWHRNQDGEATLADSIYIVHDPVMCPNKAGAATGTYFNPMSSTAAEF